MPKKSQTIYFSGCLLRNPYSVTLTGGEAQSVSENLRSFGSCISRVSCVGLKSLHLATVWWRGSLPRHLPKLPFLRFQSKHHYRFWSHCPQILIIPAVSNIQLWGLAVRRRTNTGSWMDANKSSRCPLSIEWRVTNLAIVWFLKCKFKINWSGLVQRVWIFLFLWARLCKLNMYLGSCKLIFWKPF